ncbi:MAG: hypothetical protein ACI4I4_06285 [Acutalibacteraceae bacterium]
MIVTRKLSKFKKVVITATAAVLALSSTAFICANATMQNVKASATSTRVYVTLTTDYRTTLAVNKLSCRQKHTETGQTLTKTGSNGAGNATTVTAAITPNTGYKFINESITYNFYKYQFGTGSIVKCALPKI